ADEIYTQVGDTITLHPSGVVDLRKHYVNWFFGGKELAWSNPLGNKQVTVTDEPFINRLSFSEDYSLIIKNIAQEHFGIFTCAVKTGISSKMTISIQVLKVTVTMNPPYPLLPEESLSLVCNAQIPQSNKMPQIHWLNPQGEKMTNNNGQLTVIANAQHNGKWTCVVTNNGKENEAKISVTVLDLSPASSHSQYTSISSPLNIPCSIPDHISWEQMKAKGIRGVHWSFRPKTGTIPTTDDDPQRLFFLSLEEPMTWKANKTKGLTPVANPKTKNLSLTRSKGREEDRGDYVCTLEFKNGVTLNRIVHVEMLQITLSPETNLISGQQLNLTCGLGHPLPSDLQLKWFPPEQSSLPSLTPDRHPAHLTIPEVGTGDSGKWRCELWQNSTSLSSVVIVLKIGECRKLPFSLFVSLFLSLFSVIDRPLQGAPLDSSHLGMKVTSMQRRYIQLCEDYTALGQSCSKTVKQCRERPEGWLHVRDQCYYFSRDKLDWLRSRDSCAEMGSHLIILHSMEQHMEVEQLLSLSGSALAQAVSSLLETPGLYVFSDILELPNVRESINTSVFLNHIGAHSPYLEVEICLENGPHASVYQLLNLFAYGTYCDYKERAASLPELTPAQRNKLRHLSIISLASNLKCLPYSLLLQQLELKNVRELEDLLIEAVYCDIIQGKLDQRNQQVEVDCSVGRDLGPNELPNIINTLQEWCTGCEAVLCGIEEQVSRANQYRESQLKVKVQVETEVSNLQKTLKASAASPSSGPAPAGAASNQDADQPAEPRDPASSQEPRQPGKKSSKAPQKCLPYGKTVTSEVHNWDPDTARETEKSEEERKKREREMEEEEEEEKWRVVGSLGAVMMGGKTGEGEEKWSREARSWKSSVHANGKWHHRGLGGRRGEETEEKEEEEDGGGKADGGEEVRGSTGVQHYNYPD
ncbi:hypothetical protein L3Q82_013360, partial [Scortum barcoo]